ncbi:MAG: homoserine kinase [Rhodospirillum sp.]|jgi:homoserine kinase type II|nr:homoserine kinase [Rhodospirillum sp.]
MAVYTEVPDNELRAFMEQYEIGEVMACKGIAEGVENSNYLLHTTQGSYILTLYEKRVRREDLPFFLGLMQHLAAKGLNCPTPLNGKDGTALRELCGRPAAICSFLEGMWPRRPNERHCHLLGAALADLHVKGRDFAMQRPNNLSLSGWQELAAKTAARADEVEAGLAKLIADEVRYLEEHWPQGLEIGTIHADLFPDNVFFLGDKLSGLIDFYFACTDFLAYDLAVCINAWCFEGDGSFNVTKAQKMVRGYDSHRKIPAAEIAALPILARGSALRFLLTRLYDWLNHPPGAFVQPKDPLEYRRKLSFHRQCKSASAYGI